MKTYPQIGSRVEWAEEIAPSTWDLRFGMVLGSDDDRLTETEREKLDVHADVALVLDDMGEIKLLRMERLWPAGTAARKTEEQLAAQGPDAKRRRQHDILATAIKTAERAMATVLGELQVTGALGADFDLADAESHTSSASRELRALRRVVAEKGPQS
jgi:hypothetical protein